MPRAMNLKATRLEISSRTTLPVCSVSTKKPLIMVAPVWYTTETITAS